MYKRLSAILLDEFEMSDVEYGLAIAFVSLMAVLVISAIGGYIGDAVGFLMVEIKAYISSESAVATGTSP